MEWVSFGLLTILVIFLIATMVFKSRKEKEYKNDERWRLVTSKASKQIMIYYYLVSLLICIGSLYFSITGSSKTIELGLVFNYGLYTLLLSNPIEYIALRYYDSVL